MVVAGRQLAFRCHSRAIQSHDFPFVVSIITLAAVSCDPDLYNYSIQPLIVNFFSI